tara:strand:+ start:486 stop:899 length:414 start_codon:yes stop_codon:yes gene_type:complete
MKITKRQLKKLIKEEILKEGYVWPDQPDQPADVIGPLGGNHDVYTAVHDARAAIGHIFEERMDIYAKEEYSKEHYAHSITGDSPYSDYMTRLGEVRKLLEKSVVDLLNQALHEAEEMAMEEMQKHASLKTSPRQRKK